MCELLILSEFQNFNFLVLIRAIINNFTHHSLHYPGYLKVVYFHCLF